MYSVPPSFLRAQVDLLRQFLFRNSKQDYNGIPIIASNMDTVGTFDMAKTLAEVRVQRRLVQSQGS